MNTHDLKTLINSVCLPALESVAFNICLLGIYLFISLIVWVLCKENRCIAAFAALSIYLSIYPAYPYQGRGGGGGAGAQLS